MSEKDGNKELSPLLNLHSAGGWTPFLIIVSPPSSGPLSGFITSVVPVQWGSEASKRDHVFLFQSTYLRCQFHEMQLHVRRAFAFRDPPDPELSEPSLVVCKDAAKQCIAIVDSAKDVLHTSLYCLGLMVRNNSYPLPRIFTRV